VSDRMVWESKSHFSSSWNGSSAACSAVTAPAAVGAGDGS
jgi:hypothetical protein